MSFRLYEMHKLIPVFQFMSQFSLIRAPSSRKLIIVPGSSSWEVPVFQFMSQFSLIRAPSSRKLIVVPGSSSWEVMGN
jgi:hypothetical protein